MPVMMPAPGTVVAVHAEGGELRQLEKRRAGIEQRAHALARQQLAARDVALARRLAAACGPGRLGAQVGDQRRIASALVRNSAERVSRVERRIVIGESRVNAASPAGKRQARDLVRDAGKS